MSGVTQPFRETAATNARPIITHISLVNGSGTEVSSRLPVTWSTTVTNGVMRPSADLLFDITANATVAGWRGWSASSGGIAYGGQNLTPETRAVAWQYRLLAAQTSIQFNAG